MGSSLVSWVSFNFQPSAPFHLKAMHCLFKVWVDVIIHLPSVLLACKNKQKLRGIWRGNGITFARKRGPTCPETALVVYGITEQGKRRYHSLVTFSSSSLSIRSSFVSQALPISADAGRVSASQPRRWAIYDSNRSFFTYSECERLSNDFIRLCIYGEQN